MKRAVRRRKHHTSGAAAQCGGTANTSSLGRCDETHHAGGMGRAVSRKKPHTQCGGRAQCGDRVVTLRARPLSEGVMKRIMPRHETRRQSQETPYVVW